jgi:hypothetical protein
VYILDECCLATSSGPQYNEASGPFFFREEVVHPFAVSFVQVDNKYTRYVRQQSTESHPLNG